MVPARRKRFLSLDRPLESSEEIENSDLRYLSAVARVADINLMPALNDYRLLQLTIHKTTDMVRDIHQFQSPPCPLLSAW